MTFEAGAAESPNQPERWAQAAREVGMSPHVDEQQRFYGDSHRSEPDYAQGRKTAGLVCDRKNAFLSSYSCRDHIEPLQHHRDQQRRDQQL